MSNINDVWWLTQLEIVANVGHLLSSQIALYQFDCSQVYIYIGMKTVSEELNKPS